MLNITGDGWILGVRGAHFIVAADMLHRFNGKFYRQSRCCFGVNDASVDCSLSC